MTRRKKGEEHIRKLASFGGSYAITIPIDIIHEFGWRAKQKLVVKKQGGRVIIEDWKE